MTKNHCTTKTSLFGMSKAWFPKKWAMTQHNQGKKSSPYEDIEAKMAQ